MSKTIASIPILFEKDAVRAPGTLELRLLDTLNGGLIRAEVSFDGSDIAAVVATGLDELGALTEALRFGSEALDVFRASGGRVLEERRGLGVEPLEQPLERRFRMALERFGFDEELCEIVDGPTPDASGNVAFTVEVGDRRIEAFASTYGIGVPADEDPEATDAVMRVLAQFLEEHRDNTLAWYREAARLRRAAKNPPRFSDASKPNITVVGKPTPQRGFATFCVRGAAAEQEVLVFADGMVMDDCDSWFSLAEGDREAACAAALEYVFSHGEEMTSLGLDTDLLAELYR